jgi:hypothetical protein
VAVYLVTQINGLTKKVHASARADAKEFIAGHFAKRSTDAVESTITWLEACRKFYAFGITCLPRRISSPPELALKTVS